MKNWLIGEDPDAWKDWRQEEKGMTADEMVGWHHRLDGHELEQALGVGDGQGSLVCCSSRGRKHQTQLSNWIQLINSLCVLVPQLCLTLCRLMDCSPPGSSAHGVLQARILEWVTIPFSRGSSQPRDETRSPALAGRFFIPEPPEAPCGFTEI